MPTFYFDAMIKNNRHCILEDRKRESTEEKHGDEQNASDDLFVSEERPYFSDKCV